MIFLFYSISSKLYVGFVIRVALPNHSTKGLKKILNEHTIIELLRFAWNVSLGFILTYYQSKNKYFMDILWKRKNMKTKRLSEKDFEPIMNHFSSTTYKHTRSQKSHKTIKTAISPSLFCSQITKDRVIVCSVLGENCQVISWLHFPSILMYLLSSFVQ